MPSGILNVDKPRGQSSHHIVERIRAMTGVRRVGHAGTLDPLATGVLVVCVGRLATRVSEYLMDGLKTYLVEARLGVTTDTFDAAGKIVAEAPVEVGRDETERALDRFRGSIQQIPPMFSAVKHRGTPLYRLARRGVEVEREPRPVEVHRLELVDWDPPGCTLEMVCSPGTYVRAVVHDLGQVLGCGASVTGLTRLASGSFLLENAVRVEAVAQAAREGRWAELLVLVDEALTNHFPLLRVDAEEAWRLCSGQAIRGGNVIAKHGELARVYDTEDRFLALAAYDHHDQMWRPRKVFVSPRPEARAGSSD